MFLCSSYVKKALSESSSALLAGLRLNGRSYNSMGGAMSVWAGL